MVQVGDVGVAVPAVRGRGERSPTGADGHGRAQADRIPGRLPVRGRR